MEENFDLGLDLPESFEFARETIEKVLENTTKILYDKEIGLKSRKYGILNTIELLFCMVESKYIRFDTGFFEDTEEIDEPITPLIDTWVRSSIPVHKKFKAQQVKIETSMANENKSSVSFKTSFYRTNSMRKPKNSPLKIKEDPVPFPMDVQIPEISDKEEFIRLKKERDFKRKQEEMKRLEALKLEEETKKKLLAKQLNGKGKDYTYDSNGKIIVISQFKNEKNLLESTSYKFTDNPELVSKELIKSSYDPTPVMKKFKALEPIPEKPFKQSQSVTILDQLKLAPGVSIVSGPPKPVSSPRPRENTRLAYTFTEPIIKTQKIPKILPAIPVKNMPFMDIFNQTSDPTDTKQPKYEDKKLTNTTSVDKIKQYTKDMIKSNNLNSIDIFNLGILSNPQ